MTWDKLKLSSWEKEIRQNSVAVVCFSLATSILWYFGQLKISLVVGFSNWKYHWWLISVTEYISHGWFQCLTISLVFDFRKRKSEAPTSTTCSDCHLLPVMCSVQVCWTHFYIRYVRERHLDFYTPVWKTGRIMPWQCPSVRPSVRPSAFSGLFFNMLWDINLKLGICIQ